MYKKELDDNFTVQDLINKELMDKHIHFLVGDIDEYNVENTIKWIIYENIIGHKDLDKIITLYINSEGGTISDAFALIDIMNQSKCKIRTIGIGSVISSAFLIFSSGTKGQRYIAKNASIMSHQFTHSIDGKYHDLKSHVKEYDYLNERMQNILYNNSNLDIKNIKKKLLTASDTWLKPEDIIEYGIADYIL